jgi:hypothetical protein
MLRVTGEIVGDAAGAVRAIMERLSATRPLVENLTAHSAAGQRRNIDERHAPDGSPYEPLKPATIKRKLAIGKYGEAPLKTSGLMYDSIHTEIESDTEGTAGPHALDAYYFSYQNEGAPRAGIPARAFIGVSGVDYETFADDTYAFAILAVNPIESGPSDAELRAAMH